MLVALEEHPATSRRVVVDRNHSSYHLLHCPCTERPCVHGTRQNRQGGRAPSASIHITKCSMRTCKRDLHAKTSQYDRNQGYSSDILERMRACIQKHYKDHPKNNAGLRSLRGVGAAVHSSL